MILQHLCILTLLHSQWLPYNWWQIIYILIRWIFAIYYSAWLVVVFATSFFPEYSFIYLTMWGLFLWTLYLLISASACTAKMIFWIIDFCRKGRGDANERERTEEDPNDLDERDYEVVSWGNDRISWYQKVQWIFYQLGATLQIGILILYWSLLFPFETPAQVYNAQNFNTHMTGGVMAFIDIIANGIPISIYHNMYIPFAFGAVYSLFTGLYYAAGGTDPYGDPCIYPLLNFEEAPGTSAGLKIVVTCLMLPLLHAYMYTLSCFRRWLSYHLRLCCSQKVADSRKLPSISASDSNPLAVSR